jgi:hypothetical protein
VEQVAWLVSEFYGQGRAQRVTGRDGSAREIIWAGRGGAFPPPPCNVRVEVQRRNPVRVQARNELYFQAFDLAARTGTPMPVSALFELLDADGKERALAVIRAVEAQPQPQTNPQKGAM